MALEPIGNSVAVDKLKKRLKKKSTGYLETRQNLYIMQILILDLYSQTT